MPVLSIEPSTKAGVTVGDTFTLDIAISDVTDLFAYEFALGFNPLAPNAESAEPLKRALAGIDVAVHAQRI